MLVAILLVALGTILAAAVAYESAMNARRGTATIAFDESVLVGQGAEALAAYGLKTIMDQSKPGPSGSVDIFPGQPWGQPVGPIEVVPGITLEASLEDLQGRFNLNWLVDTSGAGNNNGQNSNQTPGNNGVGLANGNSTGLGGNGPIPGLQPPAPNPGAVRAFNKLLELLQIDPKWAELLIDWIDSDNLPQSQGAEDSAYLGQNPPYLTANRYITSTTELLALPGFGAENYRKLAPYISALPPGTHLNICSAPAQVLDAFSSQVNWSNDPTGLAKARDSAGACFPDKNTYTHQNLDANDLQLAGDRFVTTSSYFRLSSLITIGTTEFNLYSLLYVDGQGHYVHPVQRSFSPD
jgi:general secretion pathway protein K